MSGHSQWPMIIWSVLSYRIHVVAFFFPTYVSLEWQCPYKLHGVADFTFHTFNIFIIYIHTLVSETPTPFEDLIFTGTGLLPHYLSDPSPIIGSLCQWLTNSPRLDWCDPGVWRCHLNTCLYYYYSTIADIIMMLMISVGNSLLEILTLQIVQDIEDEVWSRFWSWSPVEILKLKFCQCLETDVWLRLWSMVENLKLDLVKILKFKFSQDFDAGVWLRLWSWCLVEILQLNFWYDLKKLLW